MPVRAVGFDLDGTLAVSRRDRESVLREAAREAGLSPPHVPDRSEYLRAHGHVEAAETREPIFAELLSDGEADPAAVATAYRESILDSLVPVPGAGGLVRELRAEYAVGLLTDGPVRAQRSKLEQLGWTDLFDGVVVTGDLGARKPRRRAFDALLDELGVDPAAAVYVGDHPERDVGGAREAGLRAVQVLGPGEEPAPRADAHLRREALAEELPRVIDDLD